MARKGENIYKRKDGRWEGRYVKGRVDGKTKFGSVFGKSYQETKEKLVASKAAWQELKAHEEAKRETLEVVSGLWIGDSEIFLKDSTVAKYRDYLRRYILPEFGARGMAGITDEDVSDFCLSLLKNGGSKNQGLSEKTVSEINRVIKSLRKYAIKHTENVKNFNNAMSTHFVIRRKRPDDGVGGPTTMIIGVKLLEVELGEEEDEPEVLQEAKGEFPVLK